MIETLSIHTGMAPITLKRIPDICSIIYIGNVSLEDLLLQQIFPKLVKEFK